MEEIIVMQAQPEGLKELQDKLKRADELLKEFNKLMEEINNHNVTINITTP